MIKISREEKSIQFIYLLVFWIITAIVFCSVCFYNYSLPQVRSKYLIIEQINKQNIILLEQANNTSHIDSLNSMLTQYNPSTSSVALENNINNELEELKKTYNQKKTDPNYRIFNQLATFYGMQLFDKRAILSATNNKAILEKDLNDCLIGFKDKENNLTIQALQNAIQPTRPQN